MACNCGPYKLEEGLNRILTALHCFQIANNSVLREETLKMQGHFLMFDLKEEFLEYFNQNVSEICSELKLQQNFDI